jgi:ABC-type branched-subunit amino acid transport system substrate-binding protein
VLVTIGVASPTGEEDNYEEIVQAAERDINAYCEEQGSRYRFQFILKYCDAQASKAASITREFKESGISLVIGHVWSSMCEASLQYVNENDVLLLSPASSSSTLSLPGDNLYRLTPPDAVQGWMCSEMLESLGYEAVVVLQRGDSWADAIYGALEKECAKKGVEIIDRIRYDPEEQEYHTYLERANRSLLMGVDTYGREGVAVQLIGFSEACVVLLQAQAYPALMETVWLGTEGSSDTYMVVYDAGEPASQVGLIGAVVAPPGWVVEGVGAMSFFDAALYDCCWVYALSVLEADGTSATDVVEVLPRVASGYRGVTGLCVLDENGDREMVDFALKGYSETSPGSYAFWEYGFYNSTSNTITWDESVYNLAS